MIQGPGFEVGWKSTTLPTCLVRRAQNDRVRSGFGEFSRRWKYSPPDSSSLLLSERGKHISTCSGPALNLLSVKLSLQLKCWHLMSCTWDALCFDFILVSVSLLWRDGVVNEPVWIFWRGGPHVNRRNSNAIFILTHFNVTSSYASFYRLVCFLPFWEDMADLCSNNAGKGSGGEETDQTSFLLKDVWRNFGLISAVRLILLNINADQGGSFPNHSDITILTHLPLRGDLALDVNDVKILYTF